MNRKIKVVQIGLGPIGLGVTRIIKEKKSVEITGAVDINPSLVGKDIGEVAEIGKLGVPIFSSLAEALKNSEADIAILTTTSSVEKIKSQILEILSFGLPVVSTCEELTYPWKTHPQISQEIDAAAKSANAAVLSTGVNPGFLMDLLPAALTAVSKSVDYVLVERIQNASFRRIPFQKKIGAGLTPTEFQNRVEDGSLRHVGLTESIHMIANKLSIELDETTESLEPVIAKQDYSFNGLSVAKGNALGVLQIGSGKKNGTELISLCFKASVGEENARDRIFIDGEPKIDSTITNGINGDIATCSIVVNSLPVVLRAIPGLRTMIDIEPISFID